VSETRNPAPIQRDISEAAWTLVGRSTVGFVDIGGSSPASLGSGTLIKFGDIVGVLTCAHVLEASLKEDEIGIVCFPVRATQIQTLRVLMARTDYIMIGSPPWGEPGPDLAFLRLFTPIIGDIERMATIANGDHHRENIVAGEPEPTGKLCTCAVAGVVAEMTKPVKITQLANGIVETTPFEGLINVGRVFVDDETADRFRLQPVPGEGIKLPTSYKGTSGGGLWKFFLNQDNSVQACLIGVAYWEKPLEDELHIVGHGQISIYKTMFDAIRQKWPVTSSRSCLIE
jgi:hypothetical protein